MSLSINGNSYSNLHFVGILGSGMSALAQFCAWSNIHVSGSDRLSDAIDVKEIHKALCDIGCTIVPQDGSGITNSTDALVVSSAIENDNADIFAAKKQNIPIFHRSDILAAIVANHRTIAVAGTSGKSSVTGMIWEFLYECKKNPSVISGANLIKLEGEGRVGNAYKGSSDILVIEADESDGTLVKYHPEISVILNISKDHKPVSETIELFRTLARQTKVVFTNADDIGLNSIPASFTFGIHQQASVHPTRIDSVTPTVTFSKNTTNFSLPLPGNHNLSNCLAAIAVCEFLNCSSENLSHAVSSYAGVKRRFGLQKANNNILVIDDYAHNPEKIKAALQTAQGFAKRVIAIFQPHGFGPTRFLKDDFIDMFSKTLRNSDILFLLPIYYAGGTAQKDISSDDIINPIRKVTQNAYVAADRKDLILRVCQHALPNNAVLVMGARDPGLGSLASEIADALDKR